ncbi:hypothetical protein [Pseudobacter ginsenosidimutans]|uniref:Uncharacterized protein n=1 Tax=Pseudobacter ginsenosidimutans TaxID=661488 RepID=A0A4Q7ML61_9BACT|nr:hypothetical protein [Pseudobacter ginsenosidimutans]QEC40302.1 hypothetical protein FSB84_00825 [Pseudobacter ginsenosidimutans]RZS69095.1 hypothetical protein EV199_4920 [Pseudobacter ginsenosidimutans]
MKNILVITISIFLTLISIFVFATKSTNFDKKTFALKCHWYVHANSNIVQGHTDSITENLFKSGLNWTLAGDPTSVCDPVQYVCAICYDDTKYTLTQALNAVWSNVLINGWQHGIDIDPTASTLKIYITDTHLIP